MLTMFWLNLLLFFLFRGFNRQFHSRPALWQVKRCNSFPDMWAGCASCVCVSHMCSVFPQSKTRISSPLSQRSVHVTLWELCSKLYLFCMAFYLFLFLVQMLTKTFLFRNKACVCNYEWMEITANDKQFIPHKQ